MSNNTKNNNLIESSLSPNDGSKNKNINESENKNGKNQNNSYNDINSTQNKSNQNSKIVKIIDTPIIIDVESWKQYNYEQTAEANLEEYLEEINNNKKENENETDNVKNIKINRVKTENVTCTCILF